MMACRPVPSPEARCDESNAFPSALRAAVRQLVDAVAQGELHPPRHMFTVNVHGEALRIPVRIYYDSDRLRASLRTAQGIDQRILACLGTRHHDGFLRQECLRYLLAAEEDWVLPYILQLAGEYVIQIVDDVARGIVLRDAAPLAAFVRDNPRYLATLGRRVRSYWHYYYEQACPDLNDYPGTRVLNYLQRLDAPLRR